MNVVVFASRKGGSGKSTLAAHVASCAQKVSERVLLIDADPQGSLSLWHQLRGDAAPELKVATRGVSELVESARRRGVEWVFIDTPPNSSAVVSDAIKAASMLVIPTRPSVFDVASVRETIEIAREIGTPYAVVINGAPARREDVDAPLVTLTRHTLEELRAPVWGGQITNRADMILALAEGEGAREYREKSRASEEVARLWSAISKSVKAISQQTAPQAGALHRQAA